MGGCRLGARWDTAPRLIRRHRNRYDRRRQQVPVRGSPRPVALVRTGMVLPGRRPGLVGRVSSRGQVWTCMNPRGERALALRVGDGETLRLLLRKKMKAVDDMSSVVCYRIRSS